MIAVAAPAHAAVGCSFDRTLYSTKYVISNVKCTGTYSANAWYKWTVGPAHAYLYTANGPFVKSGSSTAGSSGTNVIRHSYGFNYKY